uniref:Tick transposon n=1 Tax=Amblyomma triste TaxID=251400 RepID=A0A023G6U2_AMBTT
MVDPTYTDILNHYRGSRLKYPPPHKRLTQEEATSWRRLQTGTFHNLYILNKMFPTQYRDSCPWCGDSPTLYHVTWECKHNYTFHKQTNPSAEQWEGLLTSCELTAQRALVQHACEVARTSGALE